MTDTTFAMVRVCRPKATPVSISPIKQTLKRSISTSLPQSKATIIKNKPYALTSIQQRSPSIPLKKTIATLTQKASTDVSFWQRFKNYFNMFSQSNEKKLFEQQDKYLLAVKNKNFDEALRTIQDIPRESMQSTIHMRDIDGNWIAEHDTLLYRTTALTRDESEDVQYALVKALLDHGADPNYQAFAQSKKTALLYGSSQKNDHSPLRKAINTFNLGAFNALINDPRINVSGPIFFISWDIAKQRPYDAKADDFLEYAQQYRAIKQSRNTPIEDLNKLDEMIKRLKARNSLLR
jgi:hypothetical protein